MSATMKFDHPVVVSIDGQDREVLYVADAANLLMHEWPLPTDRRKIAMEAALAALRNKGEIEYARQRFIDAALEMFALRSA